jgi:hypothetical protein
MRLHPILLAALLAASPIASAGLTPADIQAPVLVTRVDCRIVIDRTGRIVDYRPRSALPAPLAERVRDMVMAVRFVPVEVDGKIVNAETDMRVSVTAEPLDDGGLRLALDNVTFPGEKTAGGPNAFDAARGGHKASPVYPREALMIGADADVLAVLRFGPDGRVVDAAVQQSALVHARARPADAARVLALFERATLAGLRQWRVDPAAMPQDSRSGDGFVGFIPVNYRTTNARTPPPEPRPGDWTLETRTAKRVPAWVPTADQAPQPGVADLADGEIGASNRRFRLAAPLVAAGT